MVFELISNVALVVALGVVIQAIGRRWGLDTLAAKLISGVLFAAVTLLVMMRPVVLGPGLIFDGRSIILSAAGLLGGPLVVAIAAVAAVVYRIYIGGVGMVMGISVIVEASVIGAVFHHFRQQDRRFETAPYLYVMGLLVHVVLVALVMTLPGAAGVVVMTRLAVPILVLYPLGVVFVCRLLLQNEERLSVFTSLERSESDLRASNSSLERMAEQLAASLSSVVDVVGTIVEARDPYTAGHEHRVSELAVSMAQRMGLPASQVERIRMAALIHDVGKVSVPAEILSKPGKLSWMEFELIKTHAESGYEILTSANMDVRITEMVREHHERCDGTGYPRGLRAHEMSMGTKVLMVADVVEAMVSHRPYRAGLGLDLALAEVERGAGAEYDEDVVRACAWCFGDGGFAFSEISS